MSKKRRLDLIRDIEEERNSYVLAYVLSDHSDTSTTVIPNIVREIYSFLREMKPLEKKEPSTSLFMVTAVIVMCRGK